MNPLRIVVVDDEEGIRDVFRAVLEELGHRVHVAADGERGLQVIRDTDADLVFLDIKLPGMSGIEVLERIRGAGGERRPKVVMITAVLDDDLYDQSIYARHPADGFITKPCSFQSIEDCLEKVTRDQGAYLKTPRDELRYAAAKVRGALRDRGLSLALAEFAAGEPLAFRLRETFRFGGALRGVLGLRAPAGLRALLRDDPDFTERDGLLTGSTASLVAQRARDLFGAEVGLCGFRTEAAAGRVTVITAAAGPGFREVHERAYDAVSPGLDRDANHAALVFLHGLLERGRADAAARAAVD